MSVWSSSGVNFSAGVPISLGAEIDTPKSCSLVLLLHEKGSKAVRKRMVRMYILLFIKNILMDFPAKIL